MYMYHSIYVIFQSERGSEDEDDECPLMTLQTYRNVMTKIRLLFGKSIFK